LFEKNNNNIPITVSVSRRSFSSRRTNRTFITFARCGLYTATRYFLDFPRRLSRGRPWVIAGAYVCVGRGIPDLTVIYWLWHFYTWPQPFVLDHTEVFVFTFFFIFLFTFNVWKLYCFSPCVRWTQIVISKCRKLRHQHWR